MTTAALCPTNHRESVRHLVGLFDFGCNMNPVCGCAALTIYLVTYTTFFFAPKTKFIILIGLRERGHCMPHSVSGEAPGFVALNMN